MTKAEKIDKWIEALNRAEIDNLGIIRMTKECKEMLVNDMKEWKKIIISMEGSRNDGTDECA